MRIVNPSTGGVVSEDATRVDPDRWPTRPRPGDVVVELRPSVRPGMPYDLAAYPADWLVD